MPLAEGAGRRIACRFGCIFPSHSGCLPETTAALFSDQDKDAALTGIVQEGIGCLGLRFGEQFGDDDDRVSGSLRQIVFGEDRNGTACFTEEVDQTRDLFEAGAAE